MSFKNIRIPKRGGGTRLQRVKVLKSGKYKFVKNLSSKSKKTTSKKRKSNPKGGKKRMARKWTIPIAPTVGLLAGLVPMLEPLMKGDIFTAVNQLSANYTGYDMRLKQWNIKNMAIGILPLVVGLIVHKLVGGYLGVNRMLGRARVPLLRL